MAYGYNAPFGFRPVQWLAGATWSGQYQSYFIPSGFTFANNVNLYTNDAVIRHSNGGVDSATLGGAVQVLGTFQGCFYTDTNGLPQSLPYLLNGTTTLGGAPIEVKVTADPNILYEVQVANGTNAVNALSTVLLLPTNVNNNAYINVGTGGGGTYAAYGANNQPLAGTTPSANPATGSTRTGLSAMYLDSASLGSGNATYPLTVVQLTNNLNNPVYLPALSSATAPSSSFFNTCLVLFNADPYRSVGTAGV